MNNHKNTKNFEFEEEDFNLMITDIIDKVNNNCSNIPSLIANYVVKVLPNNNKERQLISTDSTRHKYMFFDDEWTPTKFGEKFTSDVCSKLKDECREEVKKFNYQSSRFKNSMKLDQYLCKEDKNVYKNISKHLVNRLKIND